MKSERVPFKALSIGELFEFTGAIDSGFARGPWRKVSARGYEHAVKGERYTVGSVNTETVGVESRKGNPTPRLKRADQPSQRARTTPKGTTTKKASERLKRRRALTHYEKTPGVWANPLVRVKVGSPSKATKAPPSARLKKRRKITQKAPEGFYANPAGKALYIVWHTARDGIKHQMLATFPKLAAAKEYAQAYANAHDVSVAIETKKL